MSQTRSCGRVDTAADDWDDTRRAPDDRLRLVVRLEDQDGTVLLEGVQNRFE
ncbi:hypothetical protein [Natronobacterium gregoryi]|uniref:hypothetical protein n=1 Tax=Natronobacterium gregoryi TaxID=44930 RepID=UPI0012DF9DEB|nr:hypothetical protein [Natronobacterium gregoryi]